MEHEIRVTREKLIAAVGIMAEELIGQINKECDALLAQLHPEQPKILVIQDEDDFDFDDDDDEELQSADSFIDDAPAPSSSSSSESEEPQKKVKNPPPVHYKMKPTSVGKRERKVPIRFSPLDTGTGKRERRDDDEDLTQRGKRSKVRKSDQEQWNMVRKLSAERRQRNPWWRRRFGDSLLVVYNGLGEQSANNTGPGQRWDDIEADPLSVDIHPLSHTTRTKCALCGRIRYCNRTLVIGGCSYLIGSACAKLAEAWRDFCLNADVEDLAILDESLARVQTAHAEKQKKNAE